MIQLESLSLTLGQQRVVDSLTLSLGQAGLTAIIGPNGAGKTSVLEMIGRLRKPSSGRIRVDGLDVQDTPSRLLAKKLAILRQNNQVQCRLKVEELVAFGRFPHSQGQINHADRQLIAQALATLKLTELQHRYLDELSGGQKQRAYIAMALCQNTPYLLLDEPLNNLDMRHAVDIMQTLRMISTTQNKKILVVLHDLNFAVRYADRILAMQHGQVYFQGSAQELLQGQHLQQLYGLNVQVYQHGARMLADCYGEA